MYLTSRGWWFLVLVLGLLVTGLIGSPALYTMGMLTEIIFDALPAQVSVVFGLPTSHWAGGPPPTRYTQVPVLILLGLTLFAWFAWEWLLFALRSRIAVRSLAVERSVHDERGPVDNLWAGRVFRVQVRLRLESWLNLPFVAAADRFPFGMELIEDGTRAEAALSQDAPLDLEYRVRCPTGGRVRFEGVLVRLADFQGFFYQSAFVSSVNEYRVLPVLADEVGKPATRKRHNLLPPPGIHRLRQPGSGSELLDLRDYRSGDPPKTIAWKVSARRDRLMTKEFESEVPVRCTLFLDTSNAVRLGPPGKVPLARLVNIAAAITQANASIRDLTGLCLFDEHQVMILRPARTPRHVAEVLHRLADAAGLAPTQGSESVEALLNVALPFAEETYPELMDSAINRTPFWLARDWSVRQQLGEPASRFRRARYWLGRGLATALFLTLAGVEWLVVRDLYDYVTTDFPRQIGLPPDYLPIPGPVVAQVYFIGLLFLYIPFVRFVCDGLPTLLSSRRRRLARWRKRLSALLALRHRLGPGGLGLLLEDNERFSLELQRFLAEHHVPYQLPLYDAQGRYHFAAPAKVDRLARALLQAIGKGHDNELFILLVDLLELSGRIEPLLSAVRVALARHHQVVLICPWPAGVPLPPARAPAESEQLTTLLAAWDGAHRRGLAEVRPLIQRLLAQRLHGEYHRIRRAFARLGVPVTNALSDEPIPLILERVERLRGLRRRR